MEYKYFKPNEIISLNPELVYMLDKARGIAQIPFVITSGFRTKEKNKEIGGVKDSAHLTGNAVDLQCKNSSDRLRIVASLITVGFVRIGIGKGHIHVDIDEDKPQEVLFLENEGILFLGKIK